MAKQIVKDDVTGGTDAPPLTAAPEREPISLTAREIALARGDDDEPAAGEIAADEDESPDVEADSAQFDGDEPGVDAPDDATPPTSWVDDFTRQVAAAHGVDDEDLEAFGSREAFGAALRLINKRTAPTAPTREEPAAPEAPAYLDKPHNADGSINVEYYKKHDYDEATIALAESNRQLQEQLGKQNQQSEWLAKHVAQQETERYWHAVHEAFDAHRPEFYGRTTDEAGHILANALSKDQGARRVNVFQQIETLQTAYQSMGRPIPSVPQLVKQAEQMVYADELVKLQAAADGIQRQERLDAVAGQSRRRRPVATTAGGKRRKREPEEDRHSTKAIANDPDIVAIWRRAEEANGTA